MKIMLRHIPNFLTCLSLACGFYAAVLGLSGNYFGAMVAIFIAAVFDFADGFAARMLKAYSAMGKELDSLADIVSFGVAPGLMLYSYLEQMLYLSYWDESPVCKLFLLTAFVIPVFSGLRLAKFNVDERQKESFLGLPVPAHAIFWSALITVLASDVHADFCLLPQFAYLLASINPVIQIVCLSAIAIATSLLLVSEIPMFSLKIKSLTWEPNKWPIILVASAILLFLFFGVAGIAATILLYILLSIISQLKKGSNPDLF